MDTITTFYVESSLYSSVHYPRRWRQQSYMVELAQKTKYAMIAAFL